jgi:hypothetical protein
MHTDHLAASTRSTRRVLVVLDPDDPETTLRALIREADPTTTEFHLLLVYPTEEYEARRSARIDAGVPGPYTIDQLAGEARRVAQRVGSEYLGIEEVGFEALGAVGSTSDCVRRAVREANYSRIYLVEEPRPIWQRLLGTERISAVLARTLPTVVSVITAEEVLKTSTDDSECEAVKGPLEPHDGPLRTGETEVT